MESISDLTEEADRATRRPRGGRSTARMTSNEKALIRAVKNADIDQVRRLIVEENAETNFRDLFTQTPLMRACAIDEESSLEMVELLLHFGADVNAQDKRGRSALMFASMDEGKTDIVDLLIQTGKVDPNLQDEDGNSALMLAATIGNFPVMQLMLETERFPKKLDLEIENSEGETVLLAAAKMMDSKACKLLVDIGYANTDYIPEDLQKVLPRHARNKAPIKRPRQEVSAVPDNREREEQLLSTGEAIESPAAEESGGDETISRIDSPMVVVESVKEKEKDEEEALIDDAIDEILADEVATISTANGSSTTSLPRNEVRTVPEERLRQETPSREGRISPRVPVVQTEQCDDNDSQLSGEKPSSQDHRRPSQESVLGDLPSFADKTKSGANQPQATCTEDDLASGGLKSPREPLPPVIVRRPSENIIQNLTSHQIIPAMRGGQGTDGRRSPSPSPSPSRQGGDTSQNPASPARQPKEDRWVLVQDKKKGAVEVYKTKSGRIIHPNVKKGTQAMVVADAIAKMRGRGRRARGRGRGNPVSRPATQQSQTSRVYQEMPSPMKSKRHAKVYNTA